MKITLSKAQWMKLGQEAEWLEPNDKIIPLNEKYIIKFIRDDWAGIFKKNHIAPSIAVSGTKDKQEIFQNLKRSVEIILKDLKKIEHKLIFQPEMMRYMGQLGSHSEGLTPGNFLNITKSTKTGQYRYQLTYSFANNAGIGLLSGTIGIAYSDSIDDLFLTATNELTNLMSSYQNIYDSLNQLIASTPNIPPA